MDCISCLRPKSGPNMTPDWNKTRVCFESWLQVIGGQRCCYRRDSVVGHNLSPFLLFGHGKREGVSLWFYDCDIDKLMHRFYDIDKLMNRCCDIELLAILPLGLFVLIIILFIAAGSFDKKYCYKCTKRGLNLVKKWMLSMWSWPQSSHVIIESWFRLQCLDDVVNPRWYPGSSGKQFSELWEYFPGLLLVHEMHN